MYVIDDLNMGWADTRAYQLNRLKRLLTPQIPILHDEPFPPPFSLVSEIIGKSEN